MRILMKIKVVGSPGWLAPWYCFDRGWRLGAAIHSEYQGWEREREGEERKKTERTEQLPDKRRR